MKTFDGYSKEKFSDTSVLLAGGGSKELSNFIGTLNWDSTNRKLQYKKIGDTNWRDLVTFGSNATNSAAYLPLAGGTMTGLLTTTSGGSHKGIKVGNTYINAINGDLIFQNNTAIRFGGDSWDYNVWAGLKYVHSSKIIYLGLADGSAFNANSAQSNGKLYLPGIANIYTGNGSNLVWHAGNDGSGSGLDADTVDGYHANSFLLRRRMTNPSNGTSYHGAIPYVIALKAAGTPVYTDPEFASGTNSVSTYNNSGNSTVTISRIADNLGSANSSGYILQISTTSGTASPGRGGFYQNITARQNAVFAQIFRAKIPTGFSVVNAENSMGNGYTTYWLTDTAGTGKWEWYIRITICGNGGTYSSGGHVYLSGSGEVTWYLSYCNLIDLTKGNYDGLRTKYSDYTTQLKTARTLTIGNTGKSFNGSANVSWSLTEIGASAATHTHSIKINGTTKTIAASGGAAVDLGSYLPLSGGNINGTLSLYPTGLDNTAFKNTLLIKQQNSTETSGDNWGDTYPTFGIGFRRFWTSDGNPYGETTCAGIYATISSSWRGGLVFRTKNNTTSGGTHDVSALRLAPSGVAYFANTVNATTFVGSLSGNASSATKLTSSAGSSTLPIYFSNGKPVQCNTTLGVSITGNADTVDNKHASDFATANHTHNLGNKPASDLSSTYPSGISVGGIYNNGYPFYFGCTITASGNSGYFQIAGQWNEAVSSSTDTDKPTEMYIRGRRDNFNVWTTWSKVLTDRNYTTCTVKKDGTGASGTWDINITGSADKIDGYHASFGSTKPWGTIPAIGSDGVIDLGCYIDLHYDNTTGSDYSTRLQLSGDYSNTINLPSASGTLALISQIPNITNYYWANIKVSASSSTSTNPTFGNTTTNKLTISNTDAIGHLVFSRGNYNYITAPTSGTIGFCVNGNTIGSSNCEMTISDGNIFPGTTNVTSLGDSSHRWSCIFSIIGDFTSYVKTSSYITFGDHGYYLTSDIRNSWRTSIYGNNASGSRLRTVRTDITIDNFSEQYGSGLAWATGDTQGYLSVSYNSGKAWIGGGNKDTLKWSTYLVTGNNIGSQSVNLANLLKYTGLGTSVFTVAQTSNDFCGRSGWATYLIGNHGNGSTYYHQIIAMPFDKMPQYQRLENGTLGSWYTFAMMGYANSGDLYAAHFYENSDIRYKHNIKNRIIEITNLASLPIFDYTWEDSIEINTGTSAQAVQEILPNLVSGTDKLTLDYGVLGTIAGITACKELVKHEDELTKLKQRVLELEELINQLKNK